MRGPPQPWCQPPPCQPPCHPPQAEAEVGASAATPSEAAATATSESLRNMFVSSGLWRVPCAIGEIASRGAGRADGPAKRPIADDPRPAKLNAAGTAVSDRVHLREIVVIYRSRPRRRGGSCHESD